MKPGADSESSSAASRQPGPVKTLRRRKSQKRRWTMNTCWMHDRVCLTCKQFRIHQLVCLFQVIHLCCLTTGPTEPALHQKLQPSLLVFILRNAGTQRLWLQGHNPCLLLGKRTATPSFFCRSECSKARRELCLEYRERGRGRGCLSTQQPCFLLSC